MCLAAIAGEQGNKIIKRNFSTIIRRSPLHDLHENLKPKYGNFAGYNMPIQYSDGILNEHKFTRSNCGIFDVSHMGQLFIYGDDDLTKNLENIFPIDLQNLKMNQSYLPMISYHHLNLSYLNLHHLNYKLHH